MSIASRKHPQAVARLLPLWEAIGSDAPAAVVARLVDKDREQNPQEAPYLTQLLLCTPACAGIAGPAVFLVLEAC